MFNLFRTRVVVVQGAATTLSAAALAIPANDHLWMGSGLGGEVKQAGGEEIEVEAVRQGPAALGRVVATGAGKLGFRRLYHLVVMGQDLKVQPWQVQSALAGALGQASADGCESLTIAPLAPEDQAGTLREVAARVVAALLESLGGMTPVRQVTLAVGSAETAEVYRDAFFAALREDHA